jgi:hypothetical protein
MAFALRPVRLRSLGLVRLLAALQGRRLAQRRLPGKERLQPTAFGKLLARPRFQPLARSPQAQRALHPGRGLWLVLARLPQTPRAPQLAQLPLMASEPSRRTAR